MGMSVESGTSQTAKIPGYSMGGKTGTAEKVPRGNHKYLVSFVGFAPLDNPEVVIYVVVDEPNVEEQASSTYAQYIAQAILSEIFPYLNIYPDQETDQKLQLWDEFTGTTRMDESVNGEDGNGPSGVVIDGTENPDMPEPDVYKRQLQDIPRSLRWSLTRTFWIRRDLLLFMWKIWIRKSCAIISGNL